MISGMGYGVGGSTSKKDTKLDDSSNKTNQDFTIEKE